jgi:hypothetical protein
MKSYFRINTKELHIDVPKKWIRSVNLVLRGNLSLLVAIIASTISLIAWFYYSSIGYHLAYNDAMSHLAITRRVVDNIKPGIAQMGSVWLPLLHVLMLPTIWINFFWKTGLSGAIISIFSFIITAIFTYKTIKLLTANKIAALVGALILITNTNLLYLQTTALTEPLFIGLFITAMYFFTAWVKRRDILSIILSALFISLATLTRYDGWAVLLFATVALFISTWVTSKNKAEAEGITILFATLAGVGVFLWLLWNQLIFGDAFYFAFGEYSARSQQEVLATVKDLPTVGNFPITISAYYLATIFNIGIFTLIFGLIGWIWFMVKNKQIFMRALGVVFISPLIFNILALYFGHSVLHIAGIYGDTWFNVRYGLIMLPWAVVFTGYLVSHKNILLKVVIVLTLLIQTILFHSSGYVVTLEDGLWGSSRKNVKGTGRWIEDNIGGNDGRILASVSSHDATLFASGLPMKRFIHEGTGKLWQDALKYPDRHAQFVLMRTEDHSDYVSKMMDQVPNFYENYKLIYDDEFADVYILKTYEN